MDRKMAPRELMPASSSRPFIRLDAGFWRTAPRTARAIFAAALMLAIGHPVSTAAAAGAGPLAVNREGRIAVKTRFKQYLEALNTGDAQLRDYVAGNVAIDAPDAPDLAALVKAPRAGGFRLVPSDILLDDGGALLSAMIDFRPAAPQPAGKAVRQRTLFFTLEGGRVTAIRIANENAKFMPGDGRAMPRSAPVAEPLPATAFQPFMTREKFADYLRLFGKFNENYVLYYHPEVIFGIPPAPQPLYGREEILALYRPLRKTLDEDVVINALVIDSERGALAAEISNTMTATGPVRLPTLTMKAGDRRIASGVVFYELKGGMIIEVR